MGSLEGEVMEFTEFQLWKLGLGCLFFFLMGLFNLLPTEEQNEKPPPANDRLEKH